MGVWWPSCSASRTTSRHQTNMVNATSRDPIASTAPPYASSCMYMRPPTASVRAPKAPITGHGLGETR